MFSAVFSAALEISSGAYSTVSCESNLIGAFLVGFTVGFGGICMCLQTFTAVSSRLNKKKFVLKKLAQGVLCGLLSVLYAYLFDLEPTSAVVLTTSGWYELLNILISSLFLFCTIIYFKKVLKNIDF